MVPQILVMLQGSQLKLPEKDASVNRFKWYFGAKYASKIAWVAKMTHTAEQHEPATFGKEVDVTLCENRTTIQADSY